ncbi:MAG: hypothetical protein FP825_14825 [Hyphomonas sp.]|uniref:hypothetical protein n=1 Tax=Hyphomonas sp. TaxID=87 RepID=UPI001843AA40|nr:hypothetical protein [Hyphomonas sp.]MBA3069741.1 hypothetical protein [Hyphomonas sp.]MBU3920609.1 hypothetical protein [Alphaproteobacteria bacterium]MBU4062582.1 hypothetical protein [Alphaproteobacteria bacterium]MBU4163933.1 hypothetical protein [Alphaproteobacteria bacterium]
MSGTEYRRRASISKNSEVLWRACSDRLEQIAPDGTLVLTVPYRNVRKVRLAFAPGRFQTTRFLMDLRGETSRLILTNMHFEGFGRFEDRTETFFPLVREVVAGVAAANPAAQFSAGEEPLLYGLMLGLNVAAFSMLALLILYLPIVPGNVSLSAMVKLGIVIFTLPLLLSWAVNARPRRFDPVRDIDKVLDARSR